MEGKGWLVGALLVYASAVLRSACKSKGADMRLPMHVNGRTPRSARVDKKKKGRKEGKEERKKERKNESVLTTGHWL